MIATEHRWSPTRGCRMRRFTAYAVKQSPGTLLLSVSIRTVDGEPIVTERWTWFGRLVRVFRPGLRSRVTVTRQRELVVSDAIERR